MTNLPVLTKQYVEQRDQGYWIAGSRVSLDSVIYGFLNGESPESIAQNFPVLDLEQVYGGITFYLANRELIDQYLQDSKAESEQLQHSLRQRNSLLYQKLKTAQLQKQRDA